MQSKNDNEPDEQIDQLNGIEKIEAQRDTEKLDRIVKHEEKKHLPNLLERDIRNNWGRESEDA